MKKQASPQTQDDGLLSPEELALLSAEERQAFSVLDAVCASKSAQEAEKILDGYMEEISRTPAGLEPFDAQASLDAFLAQHKTLMQMPPQDKPVRPRLRRRVLSLLAAVLLVFSLIVTATGKNPFSVEFGKSTFRLNPGVTPDAEPRRVGDRIYYSDGTYDDRSGSLTEEEEDEILSYILDNDLTPEEAKEYILKLIEEGTYDKEVPEIPEEEMEEPLDLPSEKQTIREEGTIFEVMEKYGVHKKLFPTWIPEGFKQTELQVIIDSYYNSIDFYVAYEKGVCFLAFGTTYIIPGSKGGTTEKDSRPVEKYTRGGVDYYLTYNLSQVNADAIVDDSLVLFNGDVTKDEMKKMIDSIYEEVD